MYMWEDDEGEIREEGNTRANGKDTNNIYFEVGCS